MFTHNQNKTNEQLQYVKTLYVVPEDIDELEYLKEDADKEVERLRSLLKRREKGEDIPDESLPIYGGSGSVRLSSRYEEIDGEVVYKIENNHEIIAFAVFEIVKDIESEEG